MRTVFLLGLVFVVATFLSRYDIGVDEYGFSEIKEKSNGSNGFIMVNANGGLNQMRTGICDMVAIAKLMNGTLVLPRLDNTSYWNDPSEFKDIFDVDHFIRTLNGEVAIVTELPPEYSGVSPLVMAPVSWSNESYYREMAPLLKEHGVIQFSHSNTRLANNLPDRTQRLRCLANFEALKFVEPIQNLAQTLVQKMRKQGPYVALHLRYEKDMLSFTGCTHGLNSIEGNELTEMRYNISHWKVKEIDPESKRLNGDCPLTPEEVVLLLKALRLPRSTNIYLVAGELFGEHSMKTLQDEYPNIHTHDTLSTEEERASLEGYQNRFAAVDYIVAVESDAFVYSYDGNMARAVEGHRRYNGHRKTIIPDRKALVRLVDAYQNGTISWYDFEGAVKEIHRHRDGSPKTRSGGEDPKHEEYFYANPAPECLSII